MRNTLSVLLLLISSTALAQLPNPHYMIFAETTSSSITWKWLAVPEAKYYTIWRLCEINCEKEKPWIPEQTVSIPTYTINNLPELSLEMRLVTTEDNPFTRGTHLLGRTKLTQPKKFGPFIASNCKTLEDCEATDMLKSKLRVAGTRAIAFAQTGVCTPVLVYSTLEHPDGKTDIHAECVTQEGYKLVVDETAIKRSTDKTAKTIREAKTFEFDIVDGTMSVNPGYLAGLNGN